MSAVAIRTPQQTPSVLRVVGERTSDARRGETTVVLPLRHAGPHEVCVRWEVRGPAHLPVVAVLGGISANRHVAASRTFAERGWWDAQGDARWLAAHRVVSIDWVGSDGTLDAPIDTADQAAALAAVLDVLGIDALDAIVGCSYGAMVGLAFATTHPARVRHLVAIAGAHRPHPFASAWRALQRNVVALGQLQCDEAQGLSLARQLAMLSYRTPEEFGARFDATPILDGGSARCASEAWLAERGAAWAQKTSATAFVRLSESIDLHEILPSSVRVPTTLVAFAEDRLVPPDDIRALAAGISAPVRLQVLHSPYGHDAFLKEPDAIAHVLARALDCCEEACA
ncbi:Homoserine O-acetyltransferase [Lysobacter dokdonensis DS-58]|uniref:Homoserine O-acetyltransferase n=1 Tax=Lysobacter dokdonensis DS-58 TaxID=1300345 RepID=A0A0A2WHQ4_9GAMM|nr:homoserine O-succinyltransferase [Lysobacter dokdonensis]KGQ17795.1 Homoserine O-acetyltransferase [Lysobacter dokdonensis DS-58]